MQNGNDTSNQKIRLVLEKDGKQIPVVIDLENHRIIGFEEDGILHEELVKQLGLDNSYARKRISYIVPANPFKAILWLFLRVVSEHVIKRIDPICASRINNWLRNWNTEWIVIPLLKFKNRRLAAEYEHEMLADILDKIDGEQIKYPDKTLY